ncbi:MAG: hypothetical protein ACC661_12775, partial [Verrucomicrobiales bacterium]
DGATDYFINPLADTDGDGVLTAFDDTERDPFVLAELTYSSIDQTFTGPFNVVAALPEFLRGKAGRISFTFSDVVGDMRFLIDDVQWLAGGPSGDLSPVQAGRITGTEGLVITDVSVEIGGAMTPLVLVDLGGGKYDVRDGSNSYGNLFTSEFVDGPAFATSGLFYFAPSAQSFPLLPGDAELDEPGFQGLFSIGVSGTLPLPGDPVSPQQILLAVTPGYSSFGSNAVVANPGADKLEILKLQQRLRYLGFRDGAGVELDLDAGFGPATQNAVGVFNAAVRDRPFQAGATVVDELINHPLPTFWTGITPQDVALIILPTEGGVPGSPAEVFGTNWVREILIDVQSLGGTIEVVGISLQEGGARDAILHGNEAVGFQEGGMQIDVLATAALGQSFFAVHNEAGGQVLIAGRPDTGSNTAAHFVSRLLGSATVERVGQLVSDNQVLLPSLGFLDAVNASPLRKFGFSALNGEIFVVDILSVNEGSGVLILDIEENLAAQNALFKYQSAAAAVDYQIFYAEA